MLLVDYAMIGMLLVDYAMIGMLLVDYAMIGMLLVDYAMIRMLLLNYAMIGMLHTRGLCLCHGWDVTCRLQKLCSLSLIAFGPILHVLKGQTIQLVPLIERLVQYIVIFYI